MKTETVLQFADLKELCECINVIHASSYRIDTAKLTVKLQLTLFEIAIAVEQFHAQVVRSTHIAESTHIADGSTKSGVFQQ